MASQGYPAASRVGNPFGAPAKLTRPAALDRAVWLIRAGAAVALAGTVVLALAGAAIKTEVFDATRHNGRGKQGYTIAQLHQIASATWIALIVAGIVAVALWIWMAWAVNRERGWARIMSSVLFGVATVEVVLAGSRSSISFGFIAAQWAIGLAVVIFLWRRDVSAYIGAG